MLFTCVICAELINPSDDAHVTVCGHIFHYSCLCQWLERSKTCPQCRNKCSLSSLRRIYFNIANLDTTEGNIGILQEQLENANLKYKTSEKELDNAKKQIQELKLTQKKSVKIISKLEETVEKNKLMTNSYNDLISRLKSENQVLEQYKKQNHELKQKIELMSAVQLVLEDIGTDVEKLLKEENNPKILAVWVTTLRRELRQCEGKKNDMRKSLKAVQNDLKRVQDEKSLLEEKVISLESENYRLTNEIENLQSTKDNSNDMFSEIKNSPKEKVNDLITTNESNVLVNTFNKISPRTSENIRKIEESKSPYLSIKSSGLGLHILANLKEKKLSNINCAINLEGNLKRSTTDLSEKYSIFKKPRLDDPIIKKHNSLLVFNGFGGSEKKEISLGIIEKKKLTVNERIKSGKLKKPTS